MCIFILEAKESFTKVNASVRIAFFMNLYADAVLVFRSLASRFSPLLICGILPSWQFCRGFYLSLANIDKPLSETLTR